LHYSEEELTELERKEPRNSLKHLRNAKKLTEEKRKGGLRGKRKELNTDN
jgi:hypothetical protein